MHLSQLQDKIGRWHREQFADATTLEILDKMFEEFDELEAAKGVEDTENEAADCAIALIAYCHKRNIDLEAAILRKHQINRKRVWRRDAAGHYVRAK